jgi:RND family efflux transporter MFP subunit
MGLFVRRVSAWWVLAAMVACGGEDPSADAPFPISTPEVRTAEVDQGYVATLAATRYVEVRARVDGVIDAIPVDEGQAIRQGDTLFAVNTRMLEQQVAVASALVRGASADLAAAEVERDNTRLLVERDVVSSAELAVAEARVASVRAELEEARANASLAAVQLDMARIEAPFDGKLNRIPLKVGSTVAVHDLLTTLADNREMFAYFHLSEREALGWMGVEGHEVTLELADGNIYEEVGVVDAVSGELDPDTRTMVVRARFPNPSGMLRHGGTAKVHVRSAIQNAMLVPQRATLDIQGDYYVYVVDDDNVPRSRKIVPQLRIGESFVVESGLTPSDRIVIDGVHKVREGVAIPTETVVQEG